MIGLNGHTSAVVGHMDDISVISVRVDWLGIWLPMEGLFLRTSAGIDCGVSDLLGFAFSGLEVWVTTRVFMELSSR